MDRKNTYESPKLTRHGSFGELTLGSQTGTHLDATFHTSTPIGDLSFS
jgi:kynurenine formamidase